MNTPPPISYLISCFLQFIPALAFSMFSEHALAWGREGHETIGYVAEQLITNTHAENAVKTILVGDEDLAFAAEWPDCAKGFEYCHDHLMDEMKAFANHNKNHHKFHYTDIPVQEHTYSDSSAGADSEDIVHILSEAISTLQGSVNNVPHHFTKREALFLIAHLVGDIHQPLHVGAVYLDDSLKRVDPKSKDEIAVGTAHATEGGNFLMVGSRGLHSLWDTTHIRAAMHRLHAASPDEYASDSIKGIAVSITKRARYVS